MRKNVSFIFVIGLLSTSALMAHPLDKKCKALSDKQIKAVEKLGGDYSLFKITGFYSPKLDACVQTMEPLMGNYFKINEISNTFLTDHNLLMRCGREGGTHFSFSAKLDAIRNLNGSVSHTPYSEWADDGFGGPPVTNKMADPPFSKEKCQRLFNRWMGQLK